MFTKWEKIGEIGGRGVNGDGILRAVGRLSDRLALGRRRSDTIIIVIGRVIFVNYC